MLLKERLEVDMKAAMRARDEVKLSTIRLARSAIKYAEIDKGKEFSDEDVIAVLSTEAKRRKESIEAAERAGRADIADRERRELEVLQQYLPEQIGESELEDIVKGIITETGATSAREKGKVMSAIMQRYRGRVDGKAVQEIVGRLLPS